MHALHNVHLASSTCLNDKWFTNNAHTRDEDEDHRCDEAKAENMEAKEVVVDWGKKIVKKFQKPPRHVDSDNDGEQHGAAWGGRGWGREGHLRLRGMRVWLGGVVCLQEILMTCKFALVS
jgi:hypothetical protein